MACPDVIHVVMGHIAMVRAIPQMVVRVDDGQTRLDGLFASQSEPVRAYICVGAFWI